MTRPTLDNCNWDADLFIQRVNEYTEATYAEIEAKQAADKLEREAWAATLRLRADDFDRAAVSDPENAAYNRGMADEYRFMAERVEN